MTNGPGCASSGRVRPVGASAADSRGALSSVDVFVVHRAAVEPPGRIHTPADCGTTVEPEPDPSSRTAAWALRFRQAMWQWIMRDCSEWECWSVLSRAR